MRLFKLLIIGIVVGSIYSYAKQHAENTSENRISHDSTISWHTVTTSSGVSIKFPMQPMSKSFNRNIPSLGKIKLNTYQLVQDEDLFILLHALPLEVNIRHQPLSVLEDLIHHINDTDQLTITDKRRFILNSFRGLEYKAVNEYGSQIWYRTWKKDGQLYSIIYGSSQKRQNHRLRDIFFKSLQT